MKYWGHILFAVISGSLALGQMSTDAAIPPTWEYDMLTTTASVLKDFSGNGNNSGTITGTTTSASGRTWNGTSDWIALTSNFCGNGDCTVMLAINTANASSNGTYCESDATQANLFRFSTGGSSGVILTGSGGSMTIPNTFPTRNPDFDIYFVRRSHNRLDSGDLSRYGIKYTAAFATIGTITTVNGAIGACNEGASRVNFWAGTIAYAAGFTRALSDGNIASVYAAMAAAVYSRPVFIKPLPTIPSYSNSVWQRFGQVTFCGTAPTCGQPQVGYDPSNCELVASPCLYMFTGSSRGVEYGETANINGDSGWTFTASQIISFSAQSPGPTVIKVGSTWHIYYMLGSGGTSTIQHSTSTQRHTGWSAGVNIISTGSAGAWDSSYVSNPSVYFNSQLTPSWYMLYEGAYASGCPGTVCSGFGGATSPDGSTWTKSTANPFSGQAAILDSSFDSGSILGPFLANINGIWYAWTGNATVVQRFSSPTFNDLWGINEFHPSLRNSAGDENGQIGDVCLLDYGDGKTRIFYVGSNGGTGSGIKLAIANMPIAVLVTTNEGQITDWP